MPVTCLRRALCGITFCLFHLSFATSNVRADTLIWDVNTGTAGAQDGAGTWTTGAGNWFNQTQGLQNQNWVDGWDAIFGANDGGADTVNLVGPVTVGSLTFNAATTGTYTLAGTGVLTLQNTLITNNAASTINATLSGNTPWTKTGTGVLTLGGTTANTISGLFTVNAGRVHLAKTGNVAALSGDLSITTGGSVTFSGGTNKLAPTANVTLSGATSGFNGTGPNSADTSTVTQTLASLNISGGTFNAGANSVWNIGAVSYTAGENKVFVGNSGSKQTYGSLSLVGMNGASTSTLVNNGFTIFGNGGTLANRTSLTIGSGGLHMEGSTIHLSGGSSGSVLVLDGNVTTGGTTTSTISRVTGGTLQPFVHLSSTAGTVSRTFTVAGGGANLDIAPVIANGAATSGAIVKEGAGTLHLTGTEANTFTGGVTINAGTLRLAKSVGVAAVSSNIVVNTGGTLQLSANHQIADSAGITLNGGTMTGWSTDEQIAFFTQNSGGLASGGNTGHVTVTGALTLAGGNTLTINSNPGSSNPASWTVGSAILTGADILLGGSNGAGNPRTTLTIGAGGLTMIGRTITLNVGDAGTQMILNGDFTGAGSNNIATNSTAAQQPFIEIGAATRGFNVTSGTTTIGVNISGTGGSITKSGAGLLQLTNANTYSGVTTVSGGTLSTAGAAGALTATSGIVIQSSGTFQNGSPTTSNNNGVANRINTAATLTMGGGTFTQVSAAAGSHTQQLESLTVTGGSNSINVSAAASTTSTLTFAGANPYTRTAGAVNFVQNPGVGGSVIFSNTPSGAGNVSGGVLVGATLNGTDLIAAQSGVLTAFTGWIPTDTTTWTNGGNMDVTGSNPVPFNPETINALRFNTAGAFTMTLDGTHTIQTGMVLTTANVGANLSTITGGELRGPAGGELILSQFNTSGQLTISSNIVNHTSATALTKAGPGTVELTGTNSYTGTTLVGGGVLRASDGVGLPTASSLVLDGGVFQSTTASFSRALGSAAGQVSLPGGISGFSAASTPLTVNLGGSAATLQWGTAHFAPTTLLLNASSAAAGLTFENGLDLNGAQRTIRVDANIATISGLLSGSGASLAKTGSGTLRLTQANTFDGGTSITAGTIALGNNLALGTGLVTINGGALQAVDGARTLANNLSLTGPATLSGNNPNTLTLSGVISGSGTLTKTGTSVVQLSGNNTYTGATNVTNGILRLQSNTALGSTTGATTVSGNAHVELADGVTITGETITINTTLGGTGDGSPTTNRGGLQAGVNATATWAGDVILGVNQARLGVQEGGTLTISGNITDGANSFDVRLSGEMTGTGGLYLSGTGNSWDGQTEIVRGTIYLGTDNALPTTTVLDIHFTGSNAGERATLDLNGYNQTIGSLRNEGNTPNDAEVTNTSSTLSTLTVNETGSISYVGMINGNLALVKGGAGTMTLTRSNAFTGGTTVNQGVLQVGNVNALNSGDLTVNGGASFAGKLDLNNTSLVVDSLNGASGAVQAVIANESTTAATRTLTIGANHGSGTYAGNVINNSGGGAAGIVALNKIGSGIQTLSGTSTHSGDTTISNGTLIADYTSGAPLSTASTLRLAGGTLVISNATTATIGNIAIVQTGPDFTSSNVLRIENGATISTATLSSGGFAPTLIDLTGGGSLQVAALSGISVTNNVITQGGSPRSTIFVKEGASIGFATWDGTEIIAYTPTLLSSGSDPTVNTQNYLINADLTRTAALNMHNLQIDTAAGDVTLAMGSNSINVGSTGRSILITGSNDATITGTGAVTGGSIFFTNFSTGTTSIDISLSGQASIFAGTGLTTYSNAANPADLYVAGGTFRMSTDRNYTAGITRIYGGGIYELGADLNGGTAGDFTRAIGQTAGQVALIGNAGFSAHGADRVVALGGVGTAPTLTWGDPNFLSGPAGDNSYSLLLGSPYSTHTLEFQNNIALGTRDRRIEVADGTSNTNVDGRLTGVLSGAGSIIKDGTGRLEVTALNTYTGTTQVREGSLLVAAGARTGSGAVTVSGGAMLLGSGTISGKSFTLASSATLHAGAGTESTAMGVMTFQPATAGVLDFQSGSSVFLDIQSATNASSIDPLFGGHTIGSAEYNAYVDAFSGLGSGAHDLLLFDAPTGSSLLFSSDLTVRPNGFTGAMGQIFNLLDWMSLISADFSGFNTGLNYRTGADDNGDQFDLPELSGGLLWDVSRFTTSGIIVVVPEPSRVLLLGAGALAMLFRRRRPVYPA